MNGHRAHNLVATGLRLEAGPKIRRRDMVEIAQERTQKPEIAISVIAQVGSNYKKERDCQF